MIRIYAVLIGAAAVVGGASGAVFAAGMEIAEKLGLKSAQVQHVEVYYDPAFEDKLKQFEADYIKLRDEVVVKIGIPEDKIKLIAQDIGRLVGSEGIAASAIAENELRSLNQSCRRLSFEKPVFYLLVKDRVKDYLRKGSKLRDFSYDPKTDGAMYDFKFDISPGATRAVPFEFAMMIGSAETFTEDVAGNFSVIRTFLKDMIGSMVIHEAAELALLSELRNSTFHKRWFSDGFANVITHEALKLHYSQQDDEDYLKLIWPEKFEDLRQQANLRYWLAKEFEFGSRMPFKHEQRLELARYAFATEEAMKLTEKSGIECLAKIIAAYKQKKLPDMAGLYEAIGEVTGEDLEKSLMKYQAFTDTSEAMSRYAAAADSALKDNKFEEAVSAMFRQMELMPNPISLESMKLRMQIALTLVQMNLGGPADEGMRNTVRMLKLAGRPELDLSAREWFVVYALKAGRYESAGRYADELLAANPQHVNAMLIRMLIAGRSKQADAAADYAIRIIAVEKNKESPAYKAAQQIIKAVGEKKENADPNAKN